MSALSGRERVRLALEHRETDRVPFAMICSGINRQARAALEEYLRRERGIGVEAFLAPRLDVADVSPEYVGPPQAPRTSMWGVEYKPVSYGAGEYNEIARHPLAAAETPADLDLHAWPSIDGFDYAGLPKLIRRRGADGTRAVVIGNGNIFETSWYMRGFETMLMDLTLNPDLARAILDRVTNFYCAFFTRILQAAADDIDLIFTADDIGGQQGLLMSLPMWREFIQPCHRRLNRIIHEFGVKVIYHSDGSVSEAVPGLIDMGIDVLQALQFSARGMDPQVLKDRFGDRLCFEGGVSVQTTLPFGTADDVRAEVRDLVRILGRNGGYILGPSHVIQDGTPPENVVAMFDEAMRSGRPS